MRRLLASLVAAGAVTVAGCNLDLTNPNNPTPAGAAANPRASTGRLIAGVMSTYRANKAGQIQDFGSFGREIYNMFITDGRSITGPYRDWRQNNAFAAGSQWAGRYQNYRNAYEALKIINNTPTTTTPGLPTAFLAEEKAGANGFLKTFIALDLLHAAEARGPIGIVVDITDDVNAVLPVVSQDSALKWISAKLDEAAADLGATGATFYFRIYTGFGSGVSVTGPTTPAGVLQFNRAIKARVEAYRGSLGCGAPCYTAALTALTGTWIADLTTANRDDGYYLIYSTAAGDALNVISYAVNSDYYLHPGIDSIAGVGLDDRYRRKVALATSACSPVYNTRSEVGVSASHRPCVYATNTTPVPIIRNEELVLLRAEARWFTGDQAGANTDLAAVRLNSGGSNGGTSAVAVPAPATDPQFISELLLQRTLSLLFEGHRFPDYRRLGRLADLATLPQDVAAGFTVATASVLPSQECDARSRAGAPAPMSCPGGAAVP
jgi:starch-binding outer membrane protein, SusD/RagB family